MACCANMSCQCQCMDTSKLAHLQDVEYVCIHTCVPDLAGAYVGIYGWSSFFWVIVFSNTKEGWYRLQEPNLTVEWVERPSPILLIQWIFFSFLEDLYCLSRISLNSLVFTIRWQLVNRKPQSTGLMTQWIFNLPHHTDMVWEHLAFDNAVNYIQQCHLCHHLFQKWKRWWHRESNHQTSD